MKVIFLLGIVALLLLIPGVFAAEGKGIVRSLTFHDAIVTIAEDSDDYSVISKVKGQTDRNGEYNFTFTSGSSSVKIYVQISRNKETVVLKKFGGVNVNQSIELEAYPDGFTPPPRSNVTISPPPEEEAEVSSGTVEENISDENTTLMAIGGAELKENTELNDSENKTDNGFLTGESISGELSGKSRSFYYIVIGVIVALGLLFIIGKYRHTIFKTDSAYRYERLKSGDVMPRSKLGAGGGLDSEIIDVEDRIKKDQQEISQLKKEEKILMNQKKLEKERENLRRLRKDK